MDVGKKLHYFVKETIPVLKLETPGYISEKLEIIEYLYEGLDLVLDDPPAFAIVLGAIKKLVVVVNNLLENLESEDSL